MFHLDFFFLFLVWNRCNVHRISSYDLSKEFALIQFYSASRRRLQDIDIPAISENMFASATQLDFAYTNPQSDEIVAFCFWRNVFVIGRYFKNFRYCSFVAHATKCQPLSDGQYSIHLNLY